MLKKLFCFLLISLLAPCLHAKDEHKFEDMTRLLSKFNRYESNFKQQSYDKDKTALQTLEGKLKLEKPDHFYWESYEPYAQLLISNGKSIWHYDSDLEQVVIQDYASQIKQAPIAVVLEKPESLANTFNLDKVTHDNDASIFHLSAKDESNALTTIKLKFTDDALTGLSFTDSLQQKTDIIFSDIKVDQLIDAAIFEFQIPDGVDVLHE